MANQEHPVVALNKVEDFIHCWPKPWVRSKRTNESTRYPEFDPSLDGIRISGRSVGLRRQKEEPEVRIILSAERVESLIEPRSGLMNDGDRYYWRYLLDLRFHDGARLAVSARVNWSPRNSHSKQLLSLDAAILNTSQLSLA